MGFAISLACCEAGDCYYLSKTQPYLEPFETTFLPGRFRWPKAPGHPRGPRLLGARDLPGSERGWVMQGVAQGDLGDLSAGHEGP